MDVIRFFIAGLIGCCREDFDVEGLLEGEASSSSYSHRPLQVSFKSLRLFDEPEPGSRVARIAYLILFRTTLKSAFLRICVFPIRSSPIQMPKSFQVGSKHVLLRVLQS